MATTADSCAIWSSWKRSHLHRWLCWRGRNWNVWELRMCHICHTDSCNLGWSSEFDRSARKRTSWSQQGAKLNYYSNKKNSATIVCRRVIFCSFRYYELWDITILAINYMKFLLFSRIEILHGECPSYNCQNNDRILLIPTQWSHSFKSMQLNCKWQKRVPKNRCYGEICVLSFADLRRSWYGVSEVIVVYIYTLLVVEEYNNTMFLLRICIWLMRIFGVSVGFRKWVRIKSTCTNWFPVWTAVGTWHTTLLHPSRHAKADYRAINFSLTLFLFARCIEIPMTPHPQTYCHSACSTVTHFPHSQ